MPADPDRTDLPPVALVPTDPASAASAALAPRAHPYGGGQGFSSTWLDRVEVRVLDDRDGDGYHSSLVVTLDADTDGAFAEVSASIFLVDDRGELAVAFDTSSFGVQGRASYDAQSVEFELLDDFPSARYGLYIELHDAYYGDVLDAVGANEFHSLAGLRLEGTRRDGLDHGYAVGYGIGFSSGYPSGYSGGGYPGSSYSGGVRDDSYTTSFGAATYSGATGPGSLVALAVAALLVRLARRARSPAS